MSKFAKKYLLILLIQIINNTLAMNQEPRNQESLKFLQSIELGQPDRQEHQPQSEITIAQDTPEEIMQLETISKYQYIKNLKKRYKLAISRNDVAELQKIDREIQELRDKSKKKLRNNKIQNVLVLTNTLMSLVILLILYTK